MRWLCLAALCAGAACFSERSEFPSGVILCHRESRACPPGLSCAVDGRCYRTGDGPRDAAPADAAGACVEDELRCQGREQQRCAGGRFVTLTTCGNACLAGFCVECTPDTRRCDGQTPQECGDTGSWADLPACPAATPQCEEGACVPPCSPTGARRCAADHLAVQECDPTGQFRTVASCMNVCVDGPPVACGGECRPGSVQCGEDETPEACDGGGEWVAGTACAGICQAGACTGECRPSATRCSGARTVQTCGPTATWGADRTCTFACDASTGRCGGECVPEARRCSGDRAEVCDAAGHWVMAEQCGAGMCTAGRCGPCTDGATQCNAGIPQRCEGTVWADRQDEPCPFLCDESEGCTGECVPGTTTCAGDVRRTCESDASFSDETCPFVCIAGECAGVCEPGTQRCNATTSQTCSSTGVWTGTVSCGFGCDEATGECKPCEPEALEVTCAGGGCGDKRNNCGETVTCPACTGTGQSCGGSGLPGFCGCTPEAPAVTCAGRCAATTNNCGQSVDCPDACVAPESCGGGGSAGDCGCTPVAPEVACAGRSCGSVPDGCGGQIPCGPFGGACPEGLLCTPEGQCGVVCVPATECDATFECGTQDPGCGLPPLACGSCEDPLVCDEPNHRCRCPTADELCGDRVCGDVAPPPTTACPAVSCGTCPVERVCDGKTCVCRDPAECLDDIAGDRCAACVDKECPADYLWDSNPDDPWPACGPYACGTCTAPETCGGGGTPNVCGCPDGACESRDGGV
jgi:hypothetical protein